VKVASDPANYRIVDLGSPPAQVTVASAAIETIAGLPAERMDTVYLTLAAPLTEVSKRYVVIVSNVTFGKDATPVDSAPTVIALISERPARVRRLWTSSKDRDDSDMYFSGAISGSRNEKYYGSTDVKVSVPLWMPEAGNRVHFLAPRLDIQTSANADADPDAVDLGFSWTWFPWTLVQWENVPEIESTRSFSVTDFVWRSEFTLLPHSYQVGDETQLWITPRAGFALGRIAHVPDDSTTLKKGPIARAVAGASATLKIPVFFAKSASLSGGYEVRLLGEDEPTESDTLSAGRHHWATAKGEVAFNDFVSFALTLQDGQQPPKYKSVNRAVTFDLVLKAKRINKKATD
jgi:hypothetical protein